MTQELQEVQNAELRFVIAQLVADPSESNRRRLLRCLRSGVLVVGVSDLPTFPANDHVIRLKEETRITLLGIRSLDGAAVLAAFTDADALRERNPHAKVLIMSCRKVLQTALADGYSGIILNPAGPWALVSREEVAGILSESDGMSDSEHPQDVNRG